MPLKKIVQLLEVFPFYSLDLQLWLAVVRIFFLILSSYYEFFQEPEFSNKTRGLEKNIMDFQCYTFQFLLQCLAIPREKTFRSKI